MDHPYLENTFHPKIFMSYFSYHKPIVSFLEYDDADEGHSEQNLPQEGQVDVIDFQSVPDGKYKWILNYQDHNTKFIFLRPMESKRAIEVSTHLLSIFLTFGAPSILQSDNGREFVNCVIDKLKQLWPECVIIHGRPRHPQSQGSIERANQDVEHMLRAWMQDNVSQRWSIGLQIVQWQKNCSFHRTIGRSPYNALFGNDPKVGLTSSRLPNNFVQTITTEEEIEEIEEILQSFFFQFPNKYKSYNL
eukprot:XP_003243096.1 PREDICTED: KRAB-A domain-containing protein 2-like [Acyrthosiphon pisum]